MEAVKGQLEYHNELDNDMKENKGLFTTFLSQLLQTFVANCDFSHFKHICYAHTNQFVVQESIKCSVLMHKT